MTTKQVGGYVPHSRADVVTFGSERIGVTNGLLLKFPQVHAVGGMSLVAGELDDQGNPNRFRERDRSEFHLRQLREELGQRERCLS